MNFQKTAMVITLAAMLLCGCANEKSVETIEPTTVDIVETDEVDKHLENENIEEFEPVGSVHTSSFLDFRQTDFTITIPEKDEELIPGTIVYTAKISGRNIKFSSTEIVYYAYSDTGLIYRTEFYADNQEILESDEFMAAIKTILLKLEVVASEDDAQAVVNNLYESDSEIKVNDTYYMIDANNYVITILH